MILPRARLTSQATARAEAAAIDRTMRDVLNISRPELPATSPATVMTSAAPKVSREILDTVENLLCTLADTAAGQR